MSLESAKEKLRAHVGCVPFIEDFWRSALGIRVVLGEGLRRKWQTSVTLPAAEADAIMKEAQEP